MKSPVTMNDHSNRIFKVSRFFLGAVGFILIIFAIVTDNLGYGAAGSFGAGQVILIFVGTLVLLIGIAGNKFVNLYKGFAILFLNTLLLLLIIELGAIAIYRSGLLPQYRGIVLEFPKLPYYVSQNWTEEYWREATLSEKYQYKPYVIWRHMQFDGETIHFNKEGLRVTPGADCSPDSFKVFTFGGSTMLGWGAPDWGTIPAYLQSGLENHLDDPICVMNLAEDGFVSTQSLITLMTELQSGNVPDLVIFYDGVNEVIAAYESGKPDVHVTLSKIAAKFETPENLLLQWVKGSRTYSLIEMVAGGSTKGYPENRLEGMIVPSDGIGTENLAELLADVYLSNYRIVGTLAREYEFDYFFFLQPHLAVSKKPLTRVEQEMFSKIDADMVMLVHDFYTTVAQTQLNDTNLLSLNNVFDDQGKQIWIDDVGHITPEGNYLVAQKILELMDGEIVEK